MKGPGVRNKNGFFFRTIKTTIKVHTILDFPHWGYQKRAQMIKKSKYLVKFCEGKKQSKNQRNQKSLIPLII